MPILRVHYAAAAAAKNLSWEQYFFLHCINNALVKEAFREKVPPCGSCQNAHFR